MSANQENSAMPALSSLFAGASAPAGVVTPGGTLSSSDQKSHLGAIKKRKTGASFIRPDYRKDIRWTFAEAADFAGPHVHQNSVRRWAAQGMFRRGFAVGPLKVDAASFIKFLSTGEAQK